MTVAVTGLLKGVGGLLDPLEVEIMLSESPEILVLTQVLSTAFYIRLKILSVFFHN